MKTNSETTESPTSPSASCVIPSREGHLTPCPRLTLPRRRPLQRVNHESFFILSRFALRIDNVLFRHLDVRTYHAFGSREIIREIKGREAPYEAVRNRLRSGAAAPPPRATSSAPPPSSIPAVPSRTGFAATPASLPSTGLSSLRNGAGPSADALAEPTGEDLTPLTDANWVAGVLEELAFAEDMCRGMNLGAGSGGARDHKEWEGKGRRLEVLEVPWAAAPDS